MNKKTKQCPFCAGNTYTKSNFGLLFIKCMKCGATVSFDNVVCNNNPNKSVDYFNKRPSDKEGELS